MKKKNMIALLLTAAILGTGFQTDRLITSATEQAETEGNVESVNVTMDTQSLGLTGVENARELGGYKTEDGKSVKWGTLLRSAKLADATKEDIAKLTEEYQLGTVIDFRTTSEIESSPDPEIDGVVNKQIRILNEEDNTSSTSSAVTGIYSDDPVAAMIAMVENGVASDDMYTSIISDETAQKGYAEFFQTLLDNEEGKAVLWHCTGGKDRAGTAAVLLLSALGVDEETILQDFALTNEFNARKIEYMGSEAAKQTDDVEIIEGVKILTGVSRDYMKNMIEMMKSEYGSVIGFVTDKLGVSADEIELLRKMYLE